MIWLVLVYVVVIGLFWTREMAMRRSRRRQGVKADTAARASWEEGKL